jgi:murein DD-endopeptidase MepM/ murein hydrolase activator NlpD
MSGSTELKLLTRTPLAVTLFLALVAVAPPASAQKLFKYKDANGVWVFTDRQPGGDQPYETAQVERSFDKPGVKLFERSEADGVTLYAQNMYYAPIQLAYRITTAHNVEASAPLRGMQMLPARGDATLLSVGAADPSMPVSFDYEYQFLPGDPQAQHRPDRPYRFPFGKSSAFFVSQAYPDTVTHSDPSSQYAIDFEMPIGTHIYAARGGVVIEIASDFFEAGVDAAKDGPRANVVRILHDDGTMSLYGHLNWNSIRVVPGERVDRGQYIADSGNTGFSTGPHLHFVVQRNRGGAIVSLPIEFEGANGAPLDVHAGERYTAY